VGEASVLDFQLAEILPTIKVFVLCFAIGFGIASVKALLCRCKK